MSDFDYKGSGPPRTSRGSLMVWMGVLAVALPVIVWLFKKTKDKPVGDALSAASDLSVSSISAKAEEIRESMKKPKWWKWILGILSFIVTGGGAIWYYLTRSATQQPQGLYQLGFLGMPAPAGMETDRRYLAGVMKKQREDRFHDLATQSVTKTLAGLPIRGLTAQFGKGSYYENNQQKSEWPRKF